MRYDKGQKELTRRRILDVASRRFRGEGVAAVGLAGLMQDAGLTNGAFYAHFDSKEALVQAVLVDALDQRLADMRAAAELGASLEDAVRDYLSPAMRDAADVRCPTAALVAEVARYPDAARELFTQKIDRQIEFVASQLPPGEHGARRRLAAALFGMLVGTLQMARAVSDKTMSEQLLAGGIEAALALLRTPPP